MFDSEFFIFYGIGGILAASLMAWWYAERKRLGEPVMIFLLSCGQELVWIPLLLVWPIAVIVIIAEVALRRAARDGGPMSPARRTCFSLTLFFSFFSAAALVATWCSDDFIKRQSAEYIAKKIQPGVDRTIGYFEQPAEKPALLKRLISKADDQGAIAAELEEYRKDPQLYIRTIIMNPPERKIARDLNLVDRWKQAIFDHFQKLFRKILLDLRIVTFTNLIGFLIVAYLIAARSDLRSKVTPPAAVLCASIVFLMWSYYDNVGFFTILTGTGMGLWYPATLLILFGVGMVYSRNLKVE